MCSFSHFILSMLDLSKTRLDGFETHTHTPIHTRICWPVTSECPLTHLLGLHCLQTSG